MPSPTAKHARRKQEIVDAASEIFALHGYSDGSIESIAESIGLLKGSLYYYFDSKEEILFEVLTRTYELALANVDDVAAMTHLGPIERLREYIRKHVIFNATHLTKLATYYHDFELVGATRWSIIADQRARFGKYITSLIEEAQDADQIDSTRDAKISAFLILGAMNSTYSWYHPGGGMSPDALGVLVADLVVDGLRVPE